MGMDKNTIMGFVLLAVLFLGYFFYSSQGSLAAEKQKKHLQDSINALTQQPVPSQPVNPVPAPAAQGVQQDSSAREELMTVENKVLRITFTNKGGQPKRVELKDFKTFEKQPLMLEDGNFDNFSYAINTAPNTTLQTGDLLFSPGQTRKLPDGSQLVSFQLSLKNGGHIEHDYVLRPDNYLIDLNISFSGAEDLFTQNQMNLLWQAKANRQERDISWETQQSQVCFVENGDYDFERIVEGKSDDKKLGNPVSWVALRQQFFASTLLAKDTFESAQLNWESPADARLDIVAKLTANLRLAVPRGNNVQVPLQLYFGPDDYRILKSYGNQMYNMVPLGSGIFAFVKYINRGFVMPVFNFLSGKIKSYGLIIALLTIVIRLLISPLTYQSYLSGAKMKLLRPEMDALRAKHGSDKQAFGMEQMKLFRSAGVSPLGGCIPALLQIPIFFALYNFFNSNITLRGQGFLWAKDLSTYDSVYNFSFSIPFYGNHVSLFTILAVVTSLLISLYGLSNMQDNSNPLMKYMPFIFPVILLGVFNKLPAALTWYYTVSNTITLLIQFVIQQYIIDHEKILAKLQENKKKPVVQSKWQERIAAMQESNKKIQDLQKKTGPPKKK